LSAWLRCGRCRRVPQHSSGLHQVFLRADLDFIVQKKSRGTESIVDIFFLLHLQNNSSFRTITRVEEGIPRPVLKLAQECKQRICKLSTIDLFSGCGGLSLGLKQAGVSNCLWAVELDAMAALTYKRNFPESHVYNLSIEQWQQEQAV
jgi:methylase of polypeptide subunit release factors